MFLKTINGINFCSVENKNRNFQDVVLIILKNHPWKGKTPNFISMLKRITICTKNNFKEKTVKANKNQREAILWTKKYFILFSSSYSSLLKVIKGKNINIFSSSLNQRQSQFLLSLANRMLKTSKLKITIKEGIKIINYLIIM